MIWRHENLSREKVRKMIGEGRIQLAGWISGRIAGRLDCQGAHRRMDPESRVFFQFAFEAVDIGYRPCAECCPKAFKLWKDRRFWRFTFTREVLK